MSKNKDSTVEEGQLSFLKGNIEAIKTSTSPSWDEILQQTSSQLAEALNAKNLSFLFGSGTSSHVVGGTEVGISTMAPLAKEFIGKLGGKTPLISADDCTLLRETFGIDIKGKEFQGNLERLVETLYGMQSLNNRTNGSDKKSVALAISRATEAVQEFILKKCTDGDFADEIGDTQVLQIYRSFYRKLITRDRALPRPWIFTTNYDLFNETALDQLGMPYCNGFSGVFERRFNPATFRYALAEQASNSASRWSAVDGFIYLCKLHGSVSWIEDQVGLFPVREVANADSTQRVMIYPTPMKQSSSLGSPYSDLFREFQQRIAREQSVLFVVGYSFCDEHVNNIIYQALTIPTFRLVIFASSDSSVELAKIASLNDPRIWMISGTMPDASKAHYFKNVVDQLLPAIPTDRIDDAISKVLRVMLDREPASKGDDDGK